MREGAGRRRLLIGATAGLLGLAASRSAAWAIQETEDPIPTAPITEDEPTAETEPGETSEEAPEAVAVEEQPAGFVPTGIPPVALAIPKLGVDARVVGVALDDDGAMAAPSDPDQVGWYTLGPGMGVPGNPVFAGHVNWDGRLRVFGGLDALEPGDAILIIDAEGNGYQYVVESSHWFRAEGAPVEEIFGQPPGPMITLITCGGEYRATSREYLDRLVVRARGA